MSGVHGMKCFRLAGQLTVWACALTLLAGCIKEDEVWEEGTVNLKPGDTLPSFSIETDAGETLTDEMLVGRPSVIVFFNTRCKDCQRELPIVQRIYETYESHVHFICISREEGHAAVQAYWKAHGLTMPYSAQGDRKVYELFAKSGVPRIYIADEDKVIRQMFTDNPLARYEDVASVISSLIEEQDAVSSTPIQ